MGTCQVSEKGSIPLSRTTINTEIMNNSENNQEKNITLSEDKPTQNTVTTSSLTICETKRKSYKNPYQLSRTSLGSGCQCGGKHFRIM